MWPKRWLGYALGGLALATVGIVGACAETRASSEPSANVPPTYWQSEAPVPRPGTRYENWPDTTAPDGGGASRGDAGGTSDKFLWDDAPPPSASSAQSADHAQSPMRALDAQGADRTDGGVDAGDAGAP